MIIDGIEFNVKPITSRENVDNPEVAKFKAKTHNRIEKDYTPEHEGLKRVIAKNYPDYVLYNNTYYIPSENLYVDDRLDRFNNFNLYRKGNGIQQRLLNILIDNNEGEMIKTWCLDDLKKSKELGAEGGYMELYSFKDEQDILTQIGRMSELRIVYPDKLLDSEFNNIINNKPEFNSGCFSNRITVTYNPHFYEQEQKLYKNSITRRWIIENLQKYLVREYESDISDGEILRQFRISRVCDGFSQHSPYWIKAFIEKYNVKSIYDFCGGWGHRLLGSWNINYIYNDIDLRSVNGAKNIYNRFKDRCTTTKLFYNNDAASFTPNEDYECAFSCPPYAYVEKYLNKNSSTTVYPNYNDWLTLWWKNVVKSTLKPSLKYFVFIINNKYKKDMSDICLLPEFNLEFVEEIVLNKENNLNHFHRLPNSTGNKIKNISKGEKMMVFRVKGDCMSITPP